MRSHQAPAPAATQQATPKPEDLVYFRFGKQGAENHRKVREIVAARGGSSSIAGVIRELIGRGLADLETEQAIIAAQGRRCFGSSQCRLRSSCPASCASTHASTRNLFCACLRRFAR